MMLVTGYRVSFCAATIWDPLLHLLDLKLPYSSLFPIGVRPLNNITTIGTGDLLMENRLMPFTARNLCAMMSLKRAMSPFFLPGKLINAFYLDFGQDAHLIFCLGLPSGLTSFFSG